MCVVQVTPVTTYKDFSNLAFCFLPCPCASCGIKEEFVCESYFSTVPGAGTAEQKAYAVADCGPNCRPIIESAQYGRKGFTDTTSPQDPIVNGVNVNRVCTCGNAHYCPDTNLPPYCTTSSCNHGDPPASQCNGGQMLDVASEIQAAITNCETGPNHPCEGSLAYTCTKAWCPNAPLVGIYNFWANNYLKQIIPAPAPPAPPGDPCQGTYK